VAKLLETQADGKPTVIFNAAKQGPWARSTLAVGETSILYSQTITHQANVWLAVSDEPLFIDKSHIDQSILWPKGHVTAGGITDRYLSDYPNMYGDVSDGSCLNALTRDDDFIRGFFERHQDKLLYGSDCADTVGNGKACDGSQIIVQIRKLSSSKVIERKLLYENAKKMYHL
jgi:hypothetical protein